MQTQNTISTVINSIEKFGVGDDGPSILKLFIDLYTQNQDLFQCQDKDSKTVLTRLITVLLNKLQNTTSQLPLVETILQILWILVLAPEYKMIISQKEGIKCITTAMNTYKMSSTIQSNGCIVLVELALYDHRAGKIQDSINAIVKGMRFHRNNPGVQEHGCAALAILTMLNDDKKKEETEKKSNRSSHRCYDYSHSNRRSSGMGLCCIG